VGRCVVCWSTVASSLVVMATVVMATVVLVTMTSRPGHATTTPEPSLPVETGCGELSVSEVWVSGFAKLMTESAVRLLDVNDDQVLDVLIGFATGQIAMSDSDSGLLAS